MELLQTQQKERQDMILEPLQVMIQLSLLSNCEIGTWVNFDLSLAEFNVVNDEKVGIHVSSYVCVTTYGCIPKFNTAKKISILNFIVNKLSNNNFRYFTLSIDCNFQHIEATIE